MTKLSEWIIAKYQAWEKSQGKPQSYYVFSRFLDVPHSDLTLWLSDNGVPQGDDLVKLANRLGAEIYDVLSLPRPVGHFEGLNTAFLNLPAAFRQRLNNAILEADQTITEHRLNPESTEAKQRVVWVFERWGFKITS